MLFSRLKKYRRSQWIKSRLSYRTNGVYIVSQLIDYENEMGFF